MFRRKALMAKATRSPRNSRAKTAAKAAARNTGSRPSRPISERTSDDPQVKQAAAVEDLSRELSYNTNKAQEIGRDNAVAPPEGQHAQARGESAGASTLSEVNRSDKTGRGAAPGTNATIGPLDRVRGDDDGEPLKGMKSL